MTQIYTASVNQVLQTLFSPVRAEGETFEDYKLRCKQAQALFRLSRHADYVHKSQVVVEDKDGNKGLKGISYKNPSGHGQKPRRGNKALKKKLKRLQQKARRIMGDFRPNATPNFAEQMLSTIASRDRKIEL